MAQPDSSDRVDALRAAGNELFKSKRYHDAADSYSEAIAAAETQTSTARSDEEKDQLGKLYSNRSA